MPMRSHSSDASGGEHALAISNFNLREHNITIQPPNCSIPNLNQANIRLSTVRWAKPPQEPTTGRPCALGKQQREVNKNKIVIKKRNSGRALCTTHDDSVKNWLDSVSNWPDSVKNLPDSVKNLHDSVNMECYQQE
jgi:hypothetical protein